MNNLPLTRIPSGGVDRSRVAHATDPNNWWTLLNLKPVNGGLVQTPTFKAPGSATVGGNGSAFLVTEDPALSIPFEPPVVYYNTEQTAEYTASCPAGSVGDDVTASATNLAGTFESIVSQEVVNALAYADALATATAEANAGLVCVMHTEWREAVYVGDPKGAYWVPASSYYTGFPESPSSVDYNYNSVAYTLVLQAVLDTTDRDPDFSQTEIDFDYTSNVALTLVGGGGTFLINVPIGTGHINFLGSKSPVGNACSFKSSTSLAVLHLTVTNFRYRFVV